MKLLNDAMAPFAQSHGIEAYPQPKKPARLPFGKVQKILDSDYALLTGWQEKLYWFNKLNEYEISDIPYHQDLLSLEFPESTARISSYQRGEELFRTGLQKPSSRYDAQFQVLYYLWRKNVAMQTAIASVYEWIKRKHNGYSREIKENPRTVNAEIRRQASHMYSKYILPDEAHNTHQGWVAKADLPKIFCLLDGSIRKGRFLFHLLKYYYPRRLRPSVNVHSDLLSRWSSYHSYIGRIEELSAKNVLKRNNFYRVGEKAKDIILAWDFKKPEEAILVDGRAPETLEETIAACMGRAETRAMLKKAGMDAGNVSRFVKKIFESCQTA